MDNFLNYLSSHPIALFTLAAVSLLIIYFIFKKLLKVVLILGLILVALCAYYYYQTPEEFSTKIKKTIGEVKEKTKKVVEKGKDLTEDLDRVVKEGKKSLIDK